MACFVVPAVEGIVVKAAERHAEKVESLAHEMNIGEAVEAEENKIPMSRKLKWLTYMLWGGAILLMFEHVWHGEVTPWFPFLTAMHSQADAVAMLQEMATVGVCMALLITGVWFAMCKVADIIVKRPDTAMAAESAENSSI